MAKLGLRLRGLPTSLALGFLAAATALPFASLDFDRHHDGVMVAAAIAVRDGLLPNRDVFAQYGPVTPLLQGIWLRLFAEPALGIRLLNVLLIAIAAFAMADLGRKAPKSWPISLSAGRWATVTWIVLADHFLWVPALPWSSTVAATLQCLALLLIVRALHYSENGRISLASAFAGGAGVVVAALPFARVNVGLLSVLVVVGFSLWLLWKSPNHRRVGQTLSAAVLLSLGLFLLFMYLSGMFLPWWSQAIDGPLRWASAVGTQLGPDVLARDAVSLFWPALIAIAVILIWVKDDQDGPIARPLWIAAVSGLTSVGLVLALYRNPGLTSLYLADQVAGRSAFVDSLTRGSLSLLTLLVVVVVVAVLALLVRLTVQRRRNEVASQQLAFWCLLMGFALAGLVQYAPVPDSRHIWWGLPVGLLFLFACWGRRGTWSPLRNPMALVIAGAALAAFFSGRAYLQLERSPSPQDVVTSGMHIVDDELQLLTSTSDFLSLCVADEKALFLVKNGAWSVYDGDYHSIDSHFVKWGDPDPLGLRLTYARTVVIDVTDDDNYADQLQARGFSQTASSTHLSCFKRG